MNNDIHDPDTEVLEGGVALMDGAGALNAIDRASIDMQIATAKQYPRSITKSLREAMDLATLDEATAAVHASMQAPPRWQDDRRTIDPASRSHGLLVGQSPRRRRHRGRGSDDGHSDGHVLRSREKRRDPSPGETAHH